MTDVVAFIGLVAASILLFEMYEHLNSRGRR